jgi:hypothetical protein
MSTDNHNDMAVSPSELRQGVERVKRRVTLYNMLAVTGLATAGILTAMLGTSVIPVGYGLAAGIGAGAAGAIGAYAGMCAYIGKKGLDASLQGFGRLANDLVTNPTLAKELEQEMAQSKAAGDTDKGAEILTSFAERHGYLPPRTSSTVSQDSRWVTRADKGASSSLQR